MFEQEPDQTTQSPAGFSGTNAGNAGAYDRYIELMNEDVGDVEEAVDVLDGLPMQNMHKKLISYYLTEIEIQSDNRKEQEIDQNFYDNEQWTAEKKELLESRGQDPRVFNVIQTTINWLIGTERRSRTDHKVLPRSKNGSKPAERKTDLLKYLSDVNHSTFHTSRAFEDAVKVGCGWLEVGYSEDTDKEPVYDRYESWRNILFDSAAVEQDMSDARFIFRTKFVDEDVANSFFPDRKETIQKSRDTGYQYGVTLNNYGDEAMDANEYHLQNGFGIYNEDQTFFRNRVRLIECWFRKPTQVQRMRGGEFHNEIYDIRSTGHQQEIGAGRANIVNTTTMQVHVAIMTTEGLLYIGETPYRHNRFPFTPVFAYRRGKNGMPYGLIRGMRDPQSDMNERAAQALHILASNKVIMEAGAVPDLDEFAEEISRADAIIVKKAGAELTLNAERELAPAHMELFSRSAQMIQQQSGVTDENLGRATNATSGKAITARQDQGSLATALLFDNLRFASQIHGEKRLSMIEQFFSEKKSFRITNSRGNPEFIDVNSGLPEDDITATKADFILGEESWRETIRQAQTEALMDLMVKMSATSPQIVMGMLDIVVETMDVPHRDELVRRIRQVTGYEDPDADPNDKTPEQQAKEAAQAEEQKLKMRAAMAEIAGKEAAATEKMARAEKAMADTKKIIASIPSENLDVHRMALESAMTIMSMPNTVPIADSLLKEAGYQVGGPAQAPPPQGMPPQQGGPQPLQPQPQPVPPQARAMPMPTNQNA